MYLKYLCIIQARVTSTRFPNKIMETVGGVPMVKRVWQAAKASYSDKVVMAYPERYPDLDENDVLERFRRISKENPEYFAVIRLTADCPLITTDNINKAITAFRTSGKNYYSNHLDGFDVQIFTTDVLFGNKLTHKEHVIADFTTPDTGLSVNTPYDLWRVRKLCKTK